jgi:hypothetical protein
MSHGRRSYLSRQEQIPKISKINDTRFSGFDDKFTMYPQKNRIGRDSLLTRYAPVQAAPTVTRLDKVLAISAMYREN